MSDKINPYIAGAPVLESRMFFGREDVFSWIERSLSGKFVDHILVLHGQRRVGKTSVLKHLGKRLPKRYIPIFIDLQGRVSTTLPRFLWWLSREITRALDLPKPDREPFEEDPDYFETQFLPQVEEKLGSDVLLFTFDEFDTLENTSAQEGLALPFMAILKRLMDHNKLNFIFSIGSSGRKLENMQAAYTGFFKQALYRKISFLSESDARDLIIKPVEGILAFDLDAVDRIYEITSGHPYFIQLICHELFSVCQKSDKWQVSKSDVEGILDAVIERGTVNLKFVWDEASELEKWVLASLAQFDSGADLGTLEKSLKDQKVRFIHQDLESAVLRLREKDVLASGNRFVIYLMKLWLIQNRSIEQVREELTAINPIVSRLLQVGHEYLDQGELEKAVDSFEEALGAEEDNLEVRMGLAAAHMAREDYGRAGAEYEEVLALYPEDVAAQSGYCDAYLALGDVRFAMGRLDEAEYAYQQVLKISPKHSDGQAQMARLYHHRAVSAISGGEDIALEQARKALEFTPRDTGLQASVRELEALADGTGNIRDVLLSWGQRAKENEHWGDAADLLSAYQRMKGADESVLSLLADIREKAHTEQLSSLRTQAERMERLGEYDGAIFALNQYLSLTPEDAAQVSERIKNLKTARKQAQLREGRADAKPFWKRPLVWAGFAVVAVFSVLLVIPNSPLRTALAPEQEVVERIVVATPKPTTMPTPTPEPLPYQWSRINSAQFLERDDVTSIAIHPTDPDIIYAGMFRSGIYKTINGGVSWAPVQNGLTRGEIDNLIIDPENPEIIYAGVIDAGVYRSKDSGEHWELLDTQTQGQFWSNSWVAMDPSNSKHLVYTSGLMMSETFNGGDTWTAIVLKEHGFSYLDVAPFALIDPETQNLIIPLFKIDIHKSHMGIYLSSDRGESWEATFLIGEEEYDCQGLPILLAYDDTRDVYLFSHCRYKLISKDKGYTWETWDDLPGNSFAANENGAYLSADFNNLYTSNNGGEAWSSSRIDTNVWEPALAVSQNDSGKVAIGGEGFFISADGGKSWEKRDNGLGATATLIRFGESSDIVFLGEKEKSRYGRDLEKFYSYDLENNEYQLLSDDFCGSNPNSIWERSLCLASYIQKEPDQISPQYFYSALIGYGGFGGGQLMHTFNSGDSWSYCQSQPGSLAKTNSAIAFHPGNPNILYLATSDNGLRVSKDGCTTFSTKNGIDTKFINSVVIDPVNPNNIFVGTDSGVYISLDGGLSWGSANEGLLGALTIYELALDPNNSNNIYAITPYGLFQLEEK